MNMQRKIVSFIYQTLLTVFILTLGMVSNIICITSQAPTREQSGFFSRVGEQASALKEQAAAFKNATLKLGREKVEQIIALGTKLGITRERIISLVITAASIAAVEAGKAYVARAATQNSATTQNPSGAITKSSQQAPTQAQPTFSATAEAHFIQDSLVTLFGDIIGQQEQEKAIALFWRQRERYYDQLLAKHEIRKPTVAYLKTVFDRTSNDL